MQQHESSANVGILFVASCTAGYGDKLFLYSFRIFKLDSIFALTNHMRVLAFRT
jgi:hypothetical protein